MKIKILFAMKKIVLLILMIGLYSSSYTQEKIFDYLTPGNYEVGLKVIQTYDYSRTFGPKIIENGVMKNNARPIQILVWYPSAEKGEKLTFQDYLLLGVSEVNFSERSESEKTRLIEMHKRNFQRHGADLENMNSILNRKSYSSFNSKSQEGKFPLIVYAPGGNERCFENFMLAEYLASNGYIVASIALTGAETQLMAFDKSDYERAVDDISFVISEMHDFPNVDNSKLGLVGFCYGSMVNFTVANQNSNVDVLVDLFGANNIQNTRDEVETYRYKNLKNPKMAYLQLAGSPEERDSYIFNNYLYGDAYQYRFDKVSHNAFTAKYVSQYHYFKDQLPGGHSAEYKDTVDACYKNICKLTLHMFNAYIKNDKTSLSYLKKNPNENKMDNVSYMSHNAIKLPPYPNEFINIIKTEGASKAKQIYTEVRSKDLFWKLFTERQMIVLGYQLMNNNKTEDAKDIFSMILMDNPQSWNGYDSIGEAYYKLGDKEKAIANYKKSLELNPQNTNATKMLKEIESNI